MGRSSDGAVCTPLASGVAWYVVQFEPKPVFRVTAPDGAVPVVVVAVPVVCTAADAVLVIDTDEPVPPEPQPTKAMTVTPAARNPPSPLPACRAVLLTTFQAPATVVRA